MFGLVIVSHTGGHWLPTPLRLRHGQFTLCPCSIYYRTGNRIPLNLVILKRSHHTMLQNKKSSLLWAILIDSGGWRPIKQSVMRRFFVSRQEGIFWPFEVISLFFNLWWFQWKFWKFTQFVDPIKRSTWDFFRIFHPYQCPKMRLKRSKNVI